MTRKMRWAWTGACALVLGSCSANSGVEEAQLDAGSGGGNPGSGGPATSGASGPSSATAPASDSGADTGGDASSGDDTGTPPEEDDENYCDASWTDRATQMATPSDYHDVIGNAVAGDVILLADGTYDGGFSLTADGTEDAPIVVRAVNPLGVTIEVGDQDVGLEGRYTVLACVRILGNSGGMVRAVGEYSRVTRNVLSDPGSLGNSSIIFMNAPFVRVDHNDIGGDYELRRTGIRVKGGADQFARVDHNYIHDSPNEGGGDNTEYEGIWISTDPIFEFWIQQKITIDHNYFANWRGDNEVISIKSSGNIVSNNTLVDSWEFSVRGGEYNLVKNNYIDNGSNGITTYGLGHMVIGNELTDSAEIEVRGGKDSSGHDQSVDVIVYGNRGGTIYVGGQLEWDHPAIGTKLGANDSEIELWDEQNTELDYDYDGDVGEPMGVTLAQVGPDAP